MRSKKDSETKKEERSLNNMTNLKPEKQKPQITPQSPTKKEKK